MPRSPKRISSASTSGGRPATPLHGLPVGLLFVWALLVALLSFFLAYGSCNVAEDFWPEQVVKRGVTMAEGIVLLLSTGVVAVLRPRPRNPAAGHPGSSS